MLASVSNILTSKFTAACLHFSIVEAKTLCEALAKKMLTYLYFKWVKLFLWLRKDKGNYCDLLSVIPPLCLKTDTTITRQKHQPVL